MKGVENPNPALSRFFCHYACLNLRSTAFFELKGLEMRKEKDLISGG
jgi:hypothetical protein